MRRPRKRKPPAQTSGPREKAPTHQARTKPTRTPQNCFEMAQEGDSEDEVTYKVEAVKALRWVKGERQYLVKWEGYSESENTWEPLANLVGCAAQIRDYERAKELQDAKDKEEVLARRQAAKEKAEAHAEQLRRAALEAAVGVRPEVVELDEETVEQGGTVPGSQMLKIHKGKTGSVWTHFDLTKANPSCKCLNTAGEICDVVPAPSGGTTNYWSHLWIHHKEMWYALKAADGALSAAGKEEMEKLLAAMQSVAKPDASLKHNAGGEFLSAKLPPGAKSTLDRLVSEWIVDEDQPFNAASTPGFRKMMSTCTSGVYDGCCEKTVKHHIYAMAVEGKQEVKEFHQNLLQTVSIKPVASGDLWSKNGTALFGIVSHGISRTEVLDKRTGSTKIVWTMCEKLSGAVPCSQDRHTGEYIGEVSDEAWKSSGIQKPVEEIFARVSDNGANMLKGWEEGFQTPCADHTMELSVKVYNQHGRIAPTLEKGRGIVGYFNSSTVGYNENDKGLHKCQQSARVRENRLVQDVKTRWRSTHGMCESLRTNQEPLLLFDVRNPQAAQGFKVNRYSLEDWLINNQTVALLAPLAGASEYLEGKKYPTLNLVLPSLLGCIEHLKPTNPVRQPWDKQIIQPDDLRPEVKEARQQLYDDMVRRWKTELPQSLKRFYATATQLDPRQRKMAFPGFTSLEKHEAREWFISEFDALWRKSPPPAGAGTRAEQTRAAAGSAARKRTREAPAADSFVDFMANLAHLCEENPQEGQVLDDMEPEAKSEVEKYLEMGEVPSMSTNILEWWAAHEAELPQLSLMARQYLGCPATSASAERLFSVAGRVYDDLRQNMEDDMLETLMWARINTEKRATAHQQ